MDQPEENVNKNNVKVINEQKCTECVDSVFSYTDCLKKNCLSVIKKALTLSPNPSLPYYLLFIAL